MLVAPKRRTTDYSINDDVFEPKTGRTQKYSKKVRRNSSNKQKRNSERRRSKLLFVGALFLCFALGIYYTSLSAAIASKGYELEKLKSEVEEIKTANERLEFSAAQNSSLDKVENAALSNLGMSKPGADEIVFLSLPETDQNNAVDVESSDQPPLKDNIFANNSIYKVLSSIFETQAVDTSST